ncbi:hypothetical protein J437_LFUL004162 [Ladona fulva]|uniref:Uncharacterized protein n=1 Tax=Ladona fulva TaxID=123851 RepID=A0A8K0JZU3_LADFU|nr:hypothetical protein J437_LFUL004162 [Ladona fulva]
MGALRCRETRRPPALPEDVEPQRNRIPTEPTQEAPASELTDAQMIWEIQLGTLETGDRRTLSRIAVEMTDAASRLTGARPRPTQPKRRRKESTAADLQQLYRKRKNAAMKEIIGEESTLCPIPLRHLEAHFGKPPPQIDTGPAPSIIKPGSRFSDFSSLFTQVREASRRLRKKINLGWWWSTVLAELQITIGDKEEETRVPTGAIPVRERTLKNAARGPTFGPC